jgi:hypothetical protein
LDGLPQIARDDRLVRGEIRLELAEVDLTEDDRDLSSFTTPA